MLCEECEAMIIVANHSHICWAPEYNGQSTMFKNTLFSAQMVPKSVLLTTLDWFKWQTSSLSSYCIYFLPLYVHLSMSTESTLVLVVVWPSIELVLNHVWNCVLRHVVGLSRNWRRPAIWQGTSHWGRGVPRHWSVHTVKVRTIAWETKTKCIK